MLKRPRRLRSSGLIRNLIHETDLSLERLIQPYFLSSAQGKQEPISGFSGVYRWGIEALKHQIEKDLEHGLKSFLLFGSSSQEDKTQNAKGAYDPNGILPQAISELKKTFKDKILLFMRLS